MGSKEGFIEEGGAVSQGDIGMDGEIWGTASPSQHSFWTCMPDAQGSSSQNTGPRGLIPLSSCEMVGQPLTSLQTAVCSSVKQGLGPQLFLLKVSYISNQKL